MGDNTVQDWKTFHKERGRHVLRFGGADLERIVGTLQPAHYGINHHTVPVMAAIYNSLIERVDLDRGCTSSLQPPAEPIATSHETFDDHAIFPSFEEDKIDWVFSVNGQIVGIGLDDWYPQHQQGEWGIHAYSTIEDALEIVRSALADILASRYFTSANGAWEFARLKGQCAYTANEVEESMTKLEIGYDRRAVRLYESKLDKIDYRGINNFEGIALCSDIPTDTSRLVELLVVSTSGAEICLQTGGDEVETVEIVDGDALEVSGPQSQPEKKDLVIYGTTLIRSATSARPLLNRDLVDNAVQPWGLNHLQSGAIILYGFKGHGLSDVFDRWVTSLGLTYNKPS